jgi:hypothetical protein
VKQGTGLFRRLDAVPRSLRWALFLPAGIVGVVIVYSMVGIVLEVLGLPQAQSGRGPITRDAILAFTLALTLTLFPAVLSPRPWPVGVVMFVVVLMLYVVPVVYPIMTTPYLRARLPSIAGALTAIIIAHVLGGALGLWVIRFLAAPVNKRPRS